MISDLPLSLENRIKLANMSMKGWDKDYYRLIKGFYPKNDDSEITCLRDIQDMENLLDVHGNLLKDCQILSVELTASQKSAAKCHALSKKRLESFMLFHFVRAEIDSSFSNRFRKFIENGESLKSVKNRFEQLIAPIIKEKVRRYSI